MLKELLHINLLLCTKKMWKQSFQAYFDDAKDSSQESRVKQVSRIKKSFNQESIEESRYARTIKISIKRVFQKY